MWRVINSMSNLSIRQNSKLVGQDYLRGMGLSLATFLLLVTSCWNLLAAEPQVFPPSAVVRGAETGASARYNVQAYTIEGRILVPTNLLAQAFSRHKMGTNVSLDEIVSAAADLEQEYRRQGYATMTIVIAPKRITNGIVPLDVFQGAVAQIVVAGNRYLVSSNGVAEALNPPTVAGPPTSPAIAATGAATNQVPAIQPRTTPASPEEMARAYAALVRATADFSEKQRDTRVHVVSTNAGPRLNVEKYLVVGNTVLPPSVIAHSLTNIDGAYGTNVSFDGVSTARAELQDAYRERGYVTVAVTVPRQTISNNTVKVKVIEGHLASIEVKGNRYFSSNNVMRTLPSLHPDTILNSLIFQAELNRANANQDRQIYPKIGPGPDPGTSDLTLDVKDRLPLHAKVELNNQSSPGTPDLRLNSSAVYNNLWQQEHSLGIQYSFSPESYKMGSQWDFYDQPLVANYSGFYRMPLGSPDSP